MIRLNRYYSSFFLSLLVNGWLMKYQTKCFKYSDLEWITANGYSCLEKLATEKCKHKANQPEKKILKIKDFMKDL